MVIFAAIRLVNERDRAKNDGLGLSVHARDLKPLNVTSEYCSCASGLSAAHRNRIQIELIREEITQQADK